MIGTRGLGIDGIFFMDIREQERHEEKDNNHKELRIFDWTSLGFLRT